MGKCRRISNNRRDVQSWVNGKSNFLGAMFPYRNKCWKICNKKWYAVQSSNYSTARRSGNHFYLCHSCCCNCIDVISVDYSGFKDDTTQIEKSRVRKSISMRMKLYACTRPCGFRKGVVARFACSNANSWQYVVQWGLGENWLPNAMW